MRNCKGKMRDAVSIENYNTNNLSWKKKDRNKSSLKHHLVQN